MILNFHLGDIPHSPSVEIRRPPEIDERDPKFEDTKLCKSQLQSPEMSIRQSIGRAGNANIFSPFKRNELSSYPVSSTGQQTMSPIGDNRPATIATTMTGKTEIPTHPKVMTSGKASNITTDNVVVSRNSSNNDETPPPSSSHDGTNKSNLWLTMRDHPSIPLSIFLGLQHYITMLGGTVTYPYILTSKLCMRESDPARGYVIATTLFCSGVASFIQTTFGIRLPVIQGATFTFLVPTLAILTLPQWACPTDIQIIGNRGRNSTFRGLRSVQEQEYTEVWQSRMREISGAIIASSMVEVFLGLTGLMGFLLKFITPLSIVPTISLIGLSLFKEATAPAGESWVISGLTIVLMIILSQYITKWSIPFPFYQKGEDGLPSRMVIKRFNVIRMFPVLLTMTTVWGLCWLLTVTGVFKTGHPARTDGVMSKLISESPWFRIPYPFQWGLPTFSTGAILGMTAGVIASALEVSPISSLHAHNLLTPINVYSRLETTTDVLVCVKFPLLLLTPSTEEL